MNVSRRSTEGEIVVSRFVAAPPALVFKAWTSPEHLAHWWAPKGCTTAHVSIEARVGGRFHYCMRMPDGTEIWGLGVFREVVAPQRLVYVDSFADAAGHVVPPSHYGMSAEHPTDSLVTVTFTAEGTGTQVVIRHAIATAVQERAGTEQGWGEMLERLALHLQSN